MKTLKKRIVSLLCVFALVVSAIGVSFVTFEKTEAYAAVDSSQPIFKYLAPKSQTSYKHFTTIKTDIDSVKRSCGDIQAKGGYIMAAGAVISPAQQVVGAYTAAVGGFNYLVGGYVLKSLSKVKAGLVYVSSMDFKWTYTKSYPLKGTFKVTSYYTYKGKRVSSKKVRYIKKEFSLGERR